MQCGEWGAAVLFSVSSFSLGFAVFYQENLDIYILFSVGPCLLGFYEKVGIYRERIGTDSRGTDESLFKTWRTPYRQCCRLADARRVNGCRKEQRMLLISATLLTDMLLLLFQVTVI